MTDPADIGLLVIRLAVGITFSLHGFQKLFGWFGGGGIAGTSKWFASLGFGDGRAATLMAGSSEIIGGLGLAMGLLNPLAAAAMIGTMTTAALVNHAAHGFWSADKGWELNFYLIAVAIGLAIAGPGDLSLDHAIGIQLNGLGMGAAAAALGIVGGTLRWHTRTEP